MSVSLPVGATGRAFHALNTAGLRPVYDATRDCVLSDCPCCQGGLMDPLGLWRPVTTAIRGREKLVRCASGCQPEVMRAALEREDWRRAAQQWEAIARDAHALAAELVAQLASAAGVAS